MGYPRGQEWGVSVAQKRMFSLQVVDTDRFMDMPTSSQALYFHLGMHGDDDGFVASPRKIVRSAGCNDDDLRLLISKGYIIPFESGVVVITDWNTNNTLKNDRYHATVYIEEKKQLSTDSSGKYVLGSTLVPERFQIGSTLEPEHNLTQHNKTESVAGKPPRARFVPPTVEEVRAYCTQKGFGFDPEKFIDNYASKGWMIGSAKMKDWKAAARNWNRRDKSEAKAKVDNHDTEELIF